MRTQASSDLCSGFKSLTAICFNLHTVIAKPQTSGPGYKNLVYRKVTNIRDCLERPARNDGDGAYGAEKPDKASRSHSARQGSRRNSTIRCRAAAGCEFPAPCQEP